MVLASPRHKPSYPSNPNSPVPKLGDHRFGSSFREHRCPFVVWKNRWRFLAWLVVYSSTREAHLFALNGHLCSCPWTEFLAKRSILPEVHGGILCFVRPSLHGAAPLLLRGAFGVALPQQHRARDHGAHPGPAARRGPARNRGQNGEKVSPKMASGFRGKIHATERTWSLRDPSFFALLP